MILIAKRLGLSILMGLALVQGAISLGQENKSSLSLGSRNGAPNTSIAIPVQIFSNAGLTALQFDVLFNSVDIDVTSLAPETLSTDHLFASKTLAPGRHRALVYSPTNALFENGVIGSLELDLSNTFDEGPAGISISNVNFVTADGTALSVDIAPFVELTAPTGPVSANELESLNLSAIAIAGTGNISRITFQVDGRPIGFDVEGPYAVSWTVDVPGDVVVTAVATDSEGNVGTSPGITVSVTPSPFIDAWRQEFFTEQQRADPEIVGLHADPDGDNISNFLELAFGSHPLVADQSVVPEIEIIEEGGEEYLALRYQKPEEIDELTYTVEIYREGEGWSSAPETIEVTAIPALAGVEQVLAKSVDPISSESDLIRLRIELAP